jgi:2'-5' RNA ligase
MIGAAETALLVPVPAAEPIVETHRLAHDPVAQLGIPAHITVLYPFIEPDALDMAVERAVADVLRPFEAFAFELGDVRCFDDGVLYLAPEPVEQFIALTRAFGARWPDYPPYGGAFPDVVPHLTVAMLGGAPVAELAEELRASLPIAGRVDEVWLMEGEEGGGWTQRGVFPLSDART